jgi:hypothetical protein
MPDQGTDYSLTHSLTHYHCMSPSGVSQQLRVSEMQPDD